MKVDTASNVIWKCGFTAPSLKTSMYSSYRTLIQSNKIGLCRDMRRYLVIVVDITFPTWRNVRCSICIQSAY